MALNLQAVQRRARAAATGGNINLPSSEPVAPTPKLASSHDTVPPQTEEKSKDKGKASVLASKKRKPAPGQGKSKRVMRQLAEEKGKDLAQSSPSKSIESVSEIQGSKQAKPQLLGFTLDGDGDTRASAAWSLGNMSMHDIDRRERLFSALHEQYYEIRSDKRPIMPSVPEPVRHRPDWNINFNLDGFLGSNVGETTYEAYKYLHLPANRERLARMHYLKMEEYFAHVQMQGMIFGRELAVKCAQFHVGMLEAERNLKVALDEIAKLREESASKEKIKQYKDEIASLGSKIEQYKADLSSKSKDLTAKEEALVEVRNELTKEVDRNEELKKENEELKKELEEKVDEAKRQGRSDFLASDEYKALIAKHRLEGASDFKKSSSYESNVIGRAGDFLVQGFDLCLAQANYLGAFKSDVDYSKMSPFVDTSLNPPQEDPEGDAPVSEPVVDAEFTSLLD